MVRHADGGGFAWLPKSPGCRSFWRLRRQSNPKDNSRQPKDKSRHPEDKSRRPKEKSRHSKDTSRHPRDKSRHESEIFRHPTDNSRHHNPTHLKKYANTYVSKCFSVIFPLKQPTLSHYQQILGLHASSQGQKHANVIFWTFVRSKQSGKTSVSNPEGTIFR